MSSLSLVPKETLNERMPVYTFIEHNYISEWCTALPVLSHYSKHPYEYNDSSLAEILSFDKNFPFRLSKANGKVKFQILAGNVPIVSNCLVVTIDVNSDSVLPYAFAREAHPGALL